MDKFITELVEILDATITYIMTAVLLTALVYTLILDQEFDFQPHLRVSFRMWFRFQIACSLWERFRQQHGIQSLQANG